MSARVSVISRGSRQYAILALEFQITLTPPFTDPASIVKDDATAARIIRDAINEWTAPRSVLSCTIVSCEARPLAVGQDPTRRMLVTTVEIVY